MTNKTLEMDPVWDKMMSSFDDLENHPGQIMDNYNYITEEAEPLDESIPSTPDDTLTEHNEDKDSDPSALDYNLDDLIKNVRDNLEDEDEDLD